MTQPAPTPNQGVSIEDINKRIEKKVGVPISIRVRKVVWFPRRSALEVMPMLNAAPEADRKDLLDSLNPTTVETGKKLPIAPGYLAVYLFENEEEFRVYAMSQKDVPGRFHLSKTSPVFSSVGMTLDTWIDEVADEFSESLIGMSTAESERESILDYAETLDPTYPLSEFVSDIREGVHHEGEDEPDDVAEATPGNPPGTPGASGEEVGGPSGVATSLTPTSAIVP